MAVAVTHEYLEGAKKWSRCDHWTLEDAAYLICGLLPRVFHLTPLEAKAQQSVDIQLAYIRNHATETLKVLNPNAPEKDYRVNPVEFMKWAYNHGVSFPQELKEAVEQGQNRKIERAPRQLRNDQRHREMSRAIASYIWSTSPTITIADMAKSKEIFKYGCEGTGYTQETIEDWIRSKHPNPRAGRPKKQ